MSLSPVFLKNNVVIFTAASEYYSPYLGVLLQSVIENSTETNNYDIIVLEDNITEFTKNELKDVLKNRPNYSMRFFDVSSLLSQYSFNGPKYNSKLTLARLLIPEVMISSDKVLWIDCDTVTNRDLADLFMINIDDYLLAATRDYINLLWDSPSGWSLNEMQKQLKIDPGDYFNCGVMLLNLQKLRQSFSTKDLLKAASNRKYRFPDQDALNHLCNNSVYYLPPEWNVTDIPFHFPDMPTGIYKRTFAACENPFVVHYIGPVKPADNLARPLAKYFWKYARNTLFYEVLLDRAMRTYINDSKNIYKKIRKKIIIPFVNFVFPKYSKRRGVLKTVICAVKRRRKLS